MSDMENHTQPVLRTRGLMKRYGTVVAMNGADFDLYPNEVLGIIGDNGAGKTTLIRALSVGFPTEVQRRSFRARVCVPPRQALQCRCSSHRPC